MTDPGHFKNCLTALANRQPIHRAREERLLASLGGFAEGTAEEFAEAWGCASMSAWHRLEELLDAGLVEHEHSWSRRVHRWRVKG